ncbi:MAG: hypothetical protein K8R53_00115 [Bacteroidales bacterium]|nr:hypothetical protein [Bacteroidales bacterium]
MNILAEATNKNIYTAARLGAGVYDFLVFAEKVPSNSTVLIAPSKPVQLRRKEMDRNRSGISLSAIFSLLNNNYSWSEIFSILKKNKKPTELFINKTSMYPYTDSIVLSEPISLFENTYKKIPYYLESKQELILTGIKILKKKNCFINFIEFPYHPVLQEIERSSIIEAETEQFKNRALSLFEKFDIDSIYLDKNIQVMFDLTHLNEIGASIVSEELAKLINKHPHTTMYIIHWQDIGLQ